MPLQLSIDHRLAIARQPLSDPQWQQLGQWAEERLTFVNPAYLEAREHRRPCKHLAKQFTLFSRDEQTLWLPRGMGGELKKWLKATLPELPVEVTDRRSQPAVSQPWALQVTMRDYQIAAVERAALLRDGVVVSPTGSGKTVMAMGLVAKLQTPALILVHNRLLLEQVCEAAERCLGVEAGVLGAGRTDIRPLTVATVQTLLRRDLSELRGQFGLVILDEAHHCPAPTFTEVLLQFSARWRIGLTATPERKDRLHPMMYASLGPELVRMRPLEMLAMGSLSASSVTPVQTTFAGGRLTDHAEMMGALAAHPQRNREIVDAIVATRGARALVLVERVEHCHAMAELLRTRGLPAWGLSGRVDAAQRQETLALLKSPSGGVLVATTSLVGEGFDCPALDTLYLTVPSANSARVTQALGRVLRPHDAKARAHVYDFVDVATPGLARSWSTRLRVYRQHGARCEPAVPASFWAEAAQTSQPASQFGDGARGKAEAP